MIGTTLSWKTILESYFTSLILLAAHYALEDIFLNCAIHQDFQGIQDGRSGAGETNSITESSYPKMTHFFTIIKRLFSLSTRGFKNKTITIIGFIIV